MALDPEIHPERMNARQRQVEGLLDRRHDPVKLIGVRDAFGVRPLMLGASARETAAAGPCPRKPPARSTSSAPNSCRDRPGEMVILHAQGIERVRGPRRNRPRFCIFEHNLFSRPRQPDRQARSRECRRIGSSWRARPHGGRLFARQCTVPQRLPAAIGYSRRAASLSDRGSSGNQYMGRTFIEPIRAIPQYGRAAPARNVNRAVIEGKRVIPPMTAWFAARPAEDLARW